MLDRATLRAAISRSKLENHLGWLSAVRRDTGGPGEDRTVEYITRELESYGVPFQVHEFDSYLSYPSRATLEVLQPERLFLPVLTHSFGCSTPRDGLVADLKYLPEGDVGRGAGQAVLLDGVLSPAKVLEATRAGVAVVIFANPDRYIHNMIATTVWGTPSLSQVDRIPRVPVVSTNCEGGETLKHLLEKGPVKVRVVAEVNTGWFRSRLPEAVIPGTHLPDEFVLAGGHYCAWEVGVTDNATGVACLLEMARVLNQFRGELRRSVRIAWWPGHSHGRYAGSAWYADTFWEGMAQNCLAYYNVDSPGVRGATRYVARHTTAEMERFGLDVIRRVTGQRDISVQRPSRAADQSFLAIGVPSLSCYPFLPEGHPDWRPWTGGSGGGWWWHTEHDTLDKADVDRLIVDVELGCTVVGELCCAAVLPMDFAAVAAEVMGILCRLAEQTAGSLDFSRLLRKASAFASGAGALARVQEKLSRREKAAGSQRDGGFSELNRVLKGLSRVLLPVIYSVGGRFVHDPADLTPLVAAGGKNLMPGLARAVALPGLAGTREYGFLRAEVVREMNRVGDALDRAVALANEGLAAMAARPQ
ncbi:MAG: M28 family peptidase, partial [Firmicutes bacterium]|nr:M28 family peptidase [Bacillota bacterium]